jgi:CDP-diacylglycerol--inositol 3-phosphatidyltransferase
VVTNRDTYIPSRFAGTMSPRVTTPTTVTTVTDVILYIPNIIGYIRITCAMVSYSIMIYLPQYWYYGILFYIMNFIGDLFDGYVARQLHQTSMFGSVLDMITDRCSTTGLLYILSNEYIIDDTSSNKNSSNSSIIPIYRTLFLFLLILDISSHWVQMHSTLALHSTSSTGSNSNDSTSNTTNNKDTVVTAVVDDVHHKSDQCNQNKNFLVRWFYKYYYFFGYLCVGTEFTYIFMYIQLHLKQSQSITNNNNSSIMMIASQQLHVALLLCIPGCFLKQLVNIAQLLSSFYAIAQHDANMVNRKYDNNNKQR